MHMHMHMYMYMYMYMCMHMCMHMHMSMSMCMSRVSCGPAARNERYERPVCGLVIVDCAACRWCS